LLASACALGVCGAFFWAAQAGMLSWNGDYTRTVANVKMLGALAGITAGLPWLRAGLRPCAVLAASIVVGALTARWLVLVPLSFAWLAVRVSRSGWQTRLKLLLLLGVWLAVVVGKWLGPSWLGLSSGVLSMYWACLPAAVICLVVERARGQLAGIGALEEWIYLLAPPRFFLPFLQPISARTFVGSRQRVLTPKLALRALGLGLYGVVCLLPLKYAHYSIKNPGEGLLLWFRLPLLLENAVLIYAVNAARIFCGVALLRLLGYSLGSGFRFPLLASSFSEIYRRWNYYFFEFVTSIFYLPLVSRLRRAMPLSLAYVLAGYPSILLGVWTLDNITFQLAIGHNAKPVLEQLLDWRELLGYFGIWSLIILPQVALSKFRRLRRRLAWRVLAHVATATVAMGVLAATFYYGVGLY
jgi:hypothetical protein